MSDSNNNRKAGEAPHFAKLSIHPYVERSCFNNVKIAEQWGLPENTGLSENIQKSIKM